MFKQIKNKNATDKYPCKKCGQRNMSPNVLNGYVRGFKCAVCGTVNHPTRDMLIGKTEIKEKPMEFYTGTSNGLPPLITMCGAEFTVFGSDCDVTLWLKPKNIKRSSAFVLYDPDGSLFKHYSNTFIRKGYTVKVLNTTDFTKSTKYNPFAYIRSDTDIAKLVAAIITGTKGRGKPGDSGFILAETNLLIALISYLHSEALEIERNFNVLMEMLRNMEMRNDYDDFKNAIDIMLEDKERREPEHLSVTCYNQFKWAVKKKHIIKSCTERIALLNTEEMQDFLSNDELGFDCLFSPKTALFVIAGDTDNDYKFIVPLMYSQLFNVLCKEAVRF